MCCNEYNRNRISDRIAFPENGTPASLALQSGFRSQYRPSSCPHPSDRCCDAVFYEETMVSIGLNTSTVKDFISRYQKAENVRWCYTCGTCSSSCPVGMATGSLQPNALVYHARLGLYEPMLAMRGIWYCIACKRCSNLCPMLVKPSALLENLRREAESRKIVGSLFLQQRRALLDTLPRILWHTAQALLQGRTPDVAQSWDHWRLTPLPQTARPPIRLAPSSKKDAALRAELRKLGADETPLAACFTCRECSSACPVCREPAFFEPLKVFRLFNLGQIEELLHSPTLWVCLDCRSCIPACSQGVKGALIIRHLQELACREGIVGRDFFGKWQQARDEVFRCMVGEIDRLLDDDEAWQAHIQPPAAA